MEGNPGKWRIIHDTTDNTTDNERGGGGGGGRETPLIGLRSFQRSVLQLNNERIGRTGRGKEGPGTAAAVEILLARSDSYLGWQNTRRQAGSRARFVRKAELGAAAAAPHSPLRKSAGAAAAAAAAAVCPPARRRQRPPPPNSPGFLMSGKDNGASSSQLTPSVNE